MDKKTYEILQENMPATEICEDVIYGDGAVGAHLFFTFSQSAEVPDHHFGHFDMLIPTTGSDAKVKFFDCEVTCLFHTVTCIYIYAKQMYVFIATLCVIYIYIFGT